MPIRINANILAFIALLRCNGFQIYKYYLRIGKFKRYHYNCFQIRKNWLISCKRFTFIHF